MVLAVRLFRIRGVDKKVVVIVPHVTHGDEQMAKAESGKFSYFRLCPVQFDQDPVSAVEGAELFFARGGTCFQLAEIIYKSDARVHGLYISRDFAFFAGFAGTGIGCPTGLRGKWRWEEELARRARGRRRTRRIERPYWLRNLNEMLKCESPRWGEWFLSRRDSAIVARYEVLGMEFGHLPKSLDVVEPRLWPNGPGKPSPGFTLGFSFLSLRP
jgi:hypothetical protein